MVSIKYVNSLFLNLTIIKTETIFAIFCCLFHNSFAKYIIKSSSVHVHYIETLPDLHNNLEQSNNKIIHASKVTNNLCIFILRIYLFDTVTFLLFDGTDCGTLTASNLTNVKSVTPGNTAFDESKTVECETGYRLRNNNNNSVVSSVLKCEVTGKWTVFAGCEKKGKSRFCIHISIRLFIFPPIMAKYLSII